MSTWYWLPVHGQRHAFPGPEHPDYQEGPRLTALCGTTFAAPGNLTDVDWLVPEHQVCMAAAIPLARVRDGRQSTVRC